MTPVGIASAQVEPMQTDAGHLGETERRADEGEADHLELIRRLLVQFGRYAETLCDSHDFGFWREPVRDHSASVEGEIRRWQAMGSDALLGIQGAVLQGAIREIWNEKKNLRHAAGAIMISSRFRNEIRPENRLRAIRLKILYEVYVDSIDDLIDTDDYSFSDALDLMRDCLGSLTALGFDRQGFRAELSGRLSPAQRPATDFLTCLAESVHGAIWKSPQRPSLIREL